MALPAQASALRAVEGRIADLAGSSFAVGQHPLCHCNVHALATFRRHLILLGSADSCRHITSHESNYLETWEQDPDTGKVSVIQGSGLEWLETILPRLPGIDLLSHSQQLAEGTVHRPELLLAGQSS